MAVTLTINGTAYSYPSGTDEEWGASATAAMQALASSSNTLYVNSVVNDDTTGGTAVPASAEIVKTHGTEIDARVQTTGNETIAGVKTFSSFPVSPTGAPTTDYQVANKKYVDDNSGGGGDANPSFAAGSFSYPAANPAPLDTDTGTNGTILRQLFDDTTPEFVLGQFKVPSDVSTTGADTVTFRAIGYAVTADGNEIQYRLSHSAKNNGENWDAAFVDEDSGDKTTDANQDELDIFTWTETITNLGWAANDHVRFKLSRIAINDGSAVSGDYGIVYFEIVIPRT